jgi:hypothetical protein
MVSILLLDISVSALINSGNVPSRGSQQPIYTLKFLQNIGLVVSLN